MLLNKIQSHGDKQRKLVVHTLQTQQENATPRRFPQRSPLDNEGKLSEHKKERLIDKLSEAKAVSVVTKDKKREICSPVPMIILQDDPPLGEMTKIYFEDIYLHIPSLLFPPRHVFLFYVVKRALIEGFQSLVVISAG